MTDKKWMPLAEAIRHVMRVENCTEQEAFEKLRKRLASGKIKSRAEKFVPLPKKYPGKLQ